MANAASLSRMSQNLYEVLQQRNLVAQSTDDAIAERLAKPCTVYIGFDPTADSLHVGSLVPIMGLAHLQRCGHKPLVVVGGATAMIGDPSGKTEARKMLTREEIDHNAQAIGKQIGQVLEFSDAPNGAVLLNNADWLADKTWIELLREAGPHFSVNRMLTMDSVKGRMETGGISFLEFNYMVMQAYDFLELFKSHKCTIQMGGQDQWGNIVMGIELGRRIADASLAGLTMPLVTKSDGGKFGKSEKGNIWLSAERTPVYEFFQFWRNVADDDVDKFLRYFTFLSIEEIEKLSGVEGQALNASKEVLAYEVTKIVHGDEAAEQARADARKAFGAQHDVKGDSIPHETLSAAELSEKPGLLSLIVRAKLETSNGKARKLVQGRGIRIHDQVIEDPQYAVSEADIKDGYILIRAGKKRLYRFDIA